MADEQIEWVSQVRIKPEKQLVVSDEKPVTVTIYNGSPRKLAFKLRTTRVDDIKPEVGVGILPPNGSKTTFKVNYEELSNSRPFSENDRITILMQECPADVTSATQYWRDNPPKPHRFVITLKPPSEKTSTPGATYATSTEEEEDESSESSESEDE